MDQLKLCTGRDPLTVEREVNDWLTKEKPMIKKAATNVTFTGFTGPNRLDYTVSIWYNVPRSTASIPPPPTEGKRL